MVRRSQSIGVHRRLRRGDAASGLLYRGGPLQARREMTRLHIENSHLPLEVNFSENLELGTWNISVQQALAHINGERQRSATDDGVPFLGGAKRVLAQNVIGLSKRSGVDGNDAADYPVDDES
jgi:hypothetical protein